MLTLLHLVAAAGHHHWEEHRCRHRLRSAVQQLQTRDAGSPDARVQRLAASMRAFAAHADTVTSMALHQHADRLTRFCLWNDEPCEESLSNWRVWHANRQTHLHAAVQACARALRQ